jgi:hypothetical protein
MCLFVTRSPGSHLTDPALSELDLLVELFEEAVSTCRAASDLLVGVLSTALDTLFLTRWVE